MAHNSLTAQEEIHLIMLMEEASEVIKCVSKILRFGWEDYHPRDPLKRTNRALLSSELTDFSVMQMMLIASGDVEPAGMDLLRIIEDKKDYYIEKYLREN